MTQADEPLSPRAWVGDGAFPWPPTLGIPDGDDVVACYSITQLTVGRTRNDAPFLRMQLADCYGTLEARMWENVEAVQDLLRVGLYVGVRGRIERYQEERQLRVEAIAPLRVELDDLVLFLPRSARAAEHMDAELSALIASVRDAPLRRLIGSMLAADSEMGHAFRLAPAAKHNHHAYLGGLLEHTLSVAGLCDALVLHYGDSLDRDLLIAAALLHDIGKIREIGARAGFPYTDEGKLLGHILLGLQMVADAAASVEGLSATRLLLLQHLIASHQGRYEWQSPREPRTLEAIILHYADDLDAKLNQAGSLLSAVDAGWTAYDRSFGRDFLKHTGSGAVPGTESRTSARAEPRTPQRTAPVKPQSSRAARDPRPGAYRSPQETGADAEPTTEADGPAPPEALDLFADDS